MNKIFYYISFIVLIFSCSEGDIIETNISSFDTKLENCSNADKKTFVFYKVDKDKKRSLSVNFTSATFDITPETNSISVTKPTTIPLNADGNKLIYRKFSSPISKSDYFCNSVPPNNISITEELISSDGTLEISYTELEPVSTTQKRFIRTITVKNATLENDNVTIRKEILVIGTDTIEANISTDFSGTLKNCPETNTNTFVFYKLNKDKNRATSTNFTSNSFKINPEIHTISEKKQDIIKLDDATNKVTYREFSSTIPDNDITEAFCNNTLPNTITTTRKLNSSSGSIIITYTKLDPLDEKSKFIRTFTLKNIILQGDGPSIEVETQTLGTDTIPKTP
ncbi:hypothetical protein [Aquimarina longa]|uniref:hypothetical protein n=1 Tax=Aquimarina longa TaxID=1080221 RepID=UPI0007860ABA|nr:hypothetical protein [Aquimarina longa]